MALGTFILLLTKLFLLFLFQVMETSSQNNFHVAFIHKTIMRNYIMISLHSPAESKYTCFNKLLDLLLALSNNGKSKK